jgi:hypothetical protein
MKLLKAYVHMMTIYLCFCSIEILVHIDLNYDQICETYNDVPEPPKGVLGMVERGKNMVNVGAARNLFEKNQ